MIWTFLIINESTVQVAILTVLAALPWFLVGHLIGRRLARWVSGGRG